MHGSSGSLVIAINDRQVVLYILAALHPGCSRRHTNKCFLFTNSQHASAHDGHHRVIIVEIHKWRRTILKKKRFMLALQFIYITSPFVYFLKNRLMMAYLGRNMS
jgi:hypothetical protein